MRGGLGCLVTLAWLWGAHAAHAQGAPKRPASGAVALQLLGINDFHGNLSHGKRVRDRPTGGAAVLAAYLRDEAARFEGTTLIIHAGDQVGASPPTSGLLQDEPAIHFLNLLANPHCTPRRRLDPRCNLVGTLGNHEFDEGVAELLRLVRGGNAARGPFLERPYRGAHFPYVSANVVDARTGRTLLPPFVVKRVDGVEVGVIGAVLEATPTMVVAGGVRSVRFLDEPTAINRAAATLRRRGIESIVVTIHQGSPQPPYEGPTRSDVPGPAPEISALVARLDGSIDVVISGHAHAFTNALLPNAAGRPVLVTQALSAGSAFADIELEIDRASRDVVRKSARIVPTYADAGPGLTPAADVAELVARAEQAVAPLTSRVVGEASQPVRDIPHPSGESALGNLIADAQRAATGAHVALMNQGGIRTSLDAGPITWGELFSIQPFGNRLIQMDLTGAQILRALEHQWQTTPPHLLQVSGLTYTWDPQRPHGQRVVSARIGERALSPGETYRVVVNSFLAEGGSGFAVFREGTRKRTGPLDLEALVAYIEGRKVPVQHAIEGRVRVLTP